MKKHSLGDWYGLDAECPACRAELRRKFGVETSNDAVERALTCADCDAGWGEHDGTRCGGDGREPCDGASPSEAPTAPAQPATWPQATPEIAEMLRVLRAQGAR